MGTAPAGLCVRNGCTSTRIARCSATRQVAAVKGAHCLGKRIAGVFTEARLPWARKGAFSADKRELIAATTAVGQWQALGTCRKIISKTPTNIERSFAMKTLNRSPLIPGALTAAAAGGFACAAILFLPSQAAAQASPDVEEAPVPIRSLTDVPLVPGTAALAVPEVTHNRRAWQPSRSYPATSSGP